MNQKTPYKSLGIWNFHLNGISRNFEQIMKYGRSRGIVLLFVLNFLFVLFAMLFPTMVERRGRSGLSGHL